LVSKLSVVEELSALSSGSSIEEVGIDAVISLRDILSSLVEMMLLIELCFALNFDQFKLF
jgi:hypothetical protein